MLRRNRSKDEAMAILEALLSQTAGAASLAAAALTILLIAKSRRGRGRRTSN